MIHAVNSLTEFEYSSLLIGRGVLAEALASALHSDEVRRCVRRTFYLDHFAIPDSGLLAPTLEECMDTRYQLVFLDCTDPEYWEDRVECIKRIRKCSMITETVILVSPKSAHHLADLLGAGAWYFLRTPVSSESLAAILGRVVALSEANGLARIDGLTGLYNRAFFEDALRDHIEKLKSNVGGKRSGVMPPATLIVADMDNFPEAFGEDRNAREMFLREVGTVFRRGHRPTDAVARVGGDEFSSLLVGVNYTLGLMRCEILRKGVTKIDLPTGAESRPTVSIGVVTYPSFFEDPQQLSWHARRALNHAKDRGGNVVVGFDPSGTPAPFSELGG